MSKNVNAKVSLLRGDYIENGKSASETSRLRTSGGGHIHISTKDTLGRIKDELGLHTDVELAEAMGVGIRRIHNWKQRNTIPTEAIVALCGAEGLDLEYILTGNRAPANRTDSSPSAAFEPNLSPNLNARVNPPYQRYVRYDGNGNVTCSFESPQIVDVLAPGTNWLIHALGVQPDSLLLMKVVGDNMAPWVQDGDLVFVDTSCKSTINGGVLALRYSDGTMTLRRIFRNPDGTLLGKCDAISCEADIIDITNEDLYPLVVGRVVRRLVR